MNATGSVNGNMDPMQITIGGDREVSGRVTSHVGCGGESYTLYFVAQFDRAFRSYGTWSGAVATLAPASAAARTAARF